MSAYPSPRQPESTPDQAPRIRNADLSDQRLRGRSRTLGLRSRGVRRRFLATLPELDRRGLITPQYGSVFEYAAKVGGASRNEVLGALSLARRLERFPSIWQLFETGRVGRAVLLRVPIEFLEADEASWRRHLETMSKQQIEALVSAERTRLQPVAENAADSSPPPTAESNRDTTRPMRAANSETRASMDSPTRPGLPGQGEEPGAPSRVAPSNCGPCNGALSNGAPSSNAPCNCAPTHAAPTRSAPTRAGHRIFIDLSDEEYARLLVAQRERSKQAGRSVSMSETLREAFRENFLDSRPPGERAADHTERAALAKKSDAAARRATGDRVPVPVDRFVRVRSAGRCERPGCERPGDHLHHQIKARARRKTLPPRLRDLPRHHHLALVHLCHGCHGLVHEGLIRNPFAPPNRWRLREASEPPVQDASDRRFTRIRARLRASGGGEPGADGET